MSNKERTKWLDSPGNLKAALTLQVDGVEVRVIHPRELAAYKKELDGDHQQIDIEAAESYANIHAI